MGVKYELTAKTGETYKDKSGEEKNRYVRCGVILETKHGLSVKIESLPVNFDGWLNCWEPKEKERVAGQDDDWK